MSAPLPSTEDLVAALGALADAKPGEEYATADLLPTYNDWAEEHGRRVLDARTLGMVLAREATLDKRLYRGSARWRLTRAGLECRNWHK